MATDNVFTRLSQRGRQAASSVGRVRPPRPTSPVQRATRDQQAAQQDAEIEAGTGRRSQPLSGGRPQRPGAPGGLPALPPEASFSFPGAGTGARSQPTGAPSATGGRGAAGIGDPFDEPAPEFPELPTNEFGQVTPEAEAALTQWQTEYADWAARRAEHEAFQRDLAFAELEREQQLEDIERQNRLVFAQTLLSDPSQFFTALRFQQLGQPLFGIDPFSLLDPDQFNAFVDGGTTTPEQGAGADGGQRRPRQPRGGGTRQPRGGGGFEPEIEAGTGRRSRPESGAVTTEDVMALAREIDPEAFEMDGEVEAGTGRIADDVMQRRQAAFEQATEELQAGIEARIAEIDGDRPSRERGRRVSAGPRAQGGGRSRPPQPADTAARGARQRPSLMEGFAAPNPSFDPEALAAVAEQLGGQTGAEIFSRLSPTARQTPTEQSILFAEAGLRGLRPDDILAIIEQARPQRGFSGRIGLRRTR